MKKLLLILYPLISPVATSLTIVAAPKDIDGFNNILQLLIPPTNFILDKEIKAAGLDPLQEGINGNASDIYSFPVCKANVAVTYNITNIKGLSNLALDNATIVSVERANDSSITLYMKASTAHLDLAAFIDGNIKAKCGIVKPYLKINGDLIVEGLKMDFGVKVLASPAPNSEWALDIKVTKVSSDFKLIAIHLRGLDSILNPLIDFSTRAIENTFKNQIEALLDSNIKESINGLIQDQLLIFYQTWKNSLA